MGIPLKNCLIKKIQKGDPNADGRIKGINVPIIPRFLKIKKRGIIMRKRGINIQANVKLNRNSLPLNSILDNAYPVRVLTNIFPIIEKITTVNVFLRYFPIE